MQVKQAANVLELLEFFARRQKPATLAELSDELGWPRSSTFNLIGTLADKGYLYEPRARGGYYPSPRWLTMAQTVASAEPLPEAALQLVAEVARETGETTAIGAPAGTHAIFIYVIESEAPIRYFAKEGHRLPIQASSTGRAILAQYSVAERDALYRKITFERYSPTTPVNIDAVEAELRRSAARGYHYSDGDYSRDLVGIACPLPLPERRLSIVVAGPQFRCLPRAEDLATTLKSAIERFRGEIGLTLQDESQPRQV
ncbi:IclR family transcriptional regulator [Bosea sp. (in: a-proteobacteria)]|uniref:IclR family transcriptional regulator n=1 Tax=Bosea sp. (in: a-proteobacteria) TaxID=1871050 RepID=UPI002FC624F5